MYTILNKVTNLLKKRNLTIAVAESCTGGMLGEILTSVSGSSEFFLGGVIAYSNEVKRDLLLVKSDTLYSYGAVSENTAYELADNIRKLLKANIGISITGVAGPSGGTLEKPVGLVYIAISDESSTKIYRNQFSGDRKKIREDSCLNALKMLLLKLD